MASGTSENIEILRMREIIAYKNGCISQKSMQNLQNDLSLLFYFRHVDCCDHVGYREKRTRGEREQ